MTAPSVIVLGGPNGSGKSTAAVRLLRDELKVLEFVNADQIAKGLSAFRSEAHAVEAGRVMLEQLRRLASNHESFAFETTLASRTFAKWIQEIQQQLGYRFRLVYVCVPDVAINVERVATRVVLGGHGIPEATIRRRFYRSIINLFDLYLPLANRWEIFDNTGRGDPKLIAFGNAEDRPQIEDQQLWQRLKDNYDAGRSQSPD